jgi:uncharacterized protein (TIGR03083 family)
VEKTLDFTDLLRLIDERSAAFRAAIAAAPSLDVPVPTCPGWTLADLVQHVGEGRRKWAAIVAAGPAGAPADKSAWASTPPREREDLPAWLAASTRQLLDALSEAGPDRDCWTWWDTSQSPQTSGAVARHQLQEVAVHTYDAQLAVGAPQPLPDDVALDGVEEFLSTCCATTTAWPYEPAVVDYHAAEGHSWRLRLAADGVRTSRLPVSDPALHTPSDPALGAASGTATDTGTASTAPDTAPDVSAQGSAGELVLFFYGRIPVEAVNLDGDRTHLDRLIAWDPDE